MNNQEVKLTLYLEPHHKAYENPLFRNIPLILNIDTRGRFLSPSLDHPDKIAHPVGWVEL